MRDRIGRRSIHAALAALAVALCGCPTYDGTHTGRYLEVRDPGSVDERLYVLDFFRFGGFANAVVRRYRVPLDADARALDDADPLWCDWTNLSVAPEEDSGTWSSETPESPPERPSLEIRATFGDDDRARVRLGGPLEPEREFVRLEEQADNRCNTIKPFNLQVDFDLGGEKPNVLDEASEALRAPVFTIAWVALVRNPDDPLGEAVLLADRRPATYKYLGERFVADQGRALRGSIRALPVIGPKNPDVFLETGSTRIALGHFVVIEDGCEAEGGELCDPPTHFTWDRASEPVVASSLECGTPAPGIASQGTVGIGAALLFVEGSLNEIGPEMRRRIKNSDAYIERFDRENFYIVLVSFDRLGNVLDLILEPKAETLLSPSYPQVKLRLFPEDRGCLRNDLPLLWAF